MRVVKPDEKGLLEVVGVLNSGGVAVIPTDTVYGLAAHPSFPGAVERLYTIKLREHRKPIALLAASASAAGDFVGGFPDAAKGLLRYWPGALTIVSRRLSRSRPRLDAAAYSGMRRSVARDERQFVRLSPCNGCCGRIGQRRLVGGYSRR